MVGPSFAKWWSIYLYSYIVFFEYQLHLINYFMHILEYIKSSKFLLVTKIYPNANTKVINLIKLVPIRC